MLTIYAPSRAGGHDGLMRRGFLRLGALTLGGLVPIPFPGDISRSHLITWGCWSPKHQGGCDECETGEETGGAEGEAADGEADGPARSPGENPAAGSCRNGSGPSAPAGTGYGSRRCSASPPRHPLPRQPTLHPDLRGHLLGRSRVGNPYRNAYPTGLQSLPASATR